MKIAELNGFNEIATILIDLQGGLTPLVKAIQAGAIEVVKAMIEQGALVNLAYGDQLRTPLHGAAVQGDPAVIALLLENGAQPDIRDVNNHSPLDLARQKGHDSTIALLKKALPAYSPKPQGEIALIKAVQSEDEETLKALLADGAAVDKHVGSEEKTALHWAAEKGNEHLVYELLKKALEVMAKILQGKPLCTKP